MNDSPEKRHDIQLRSFQQYLGRHPESNARLVLVGGCRNEEDETRVRTLKQLAKDLGIDARVEFQLNVPYDTLKEYLGRSLVGIHTMWNEHFGIGVVEYMAAGMIAIAHDSGGPKSDIVLPDGSGRPCGRLRDSSWMISWRRGRERRRS